MLIWSEIEIAQPADSNGSKQWPKQYDRADQERPMEKHFEVELVQKQHLTMPGQRLGQPEKDRRNQRAEHNYHREINR